MKRPLSVRLRRRARQNFGEGCALLAAGLRELCAVPGHTGSGCRPPVLEPGALFSWVVFGFEAAIACFEAAARLTARAERQAATERLAGDGGWRVPELESDEWPPVVLGGES